MTQWQYSHLRAEQRYGGWVFIYKNHEVKYDTQNLDEILTDFGQQGWELVAISSKDTSEFFFFKRPLEES